MGIKGSIPILSDYKEFNKQFKNQQDFKSVGLYPILSDRYDSAGVATGHYFHQDLLVAKFIYENKPMRHVDIGSRIDGFVAHVASFRDIEVVDIRELEK